MIAAKNPSLTAFFENNRKSATQYAQSSGTDQNIPFARNAAEKSSESAARKACVMPHPKHGIPIFAKGQGIPRQQDCRRYGTLKKNLFRFGDFKPV